LDQSAELFRAAIDVVAAADEHQIGDVAVEQRGPIWRRMWLGGESRQVALQRTRFPEPNESVTLPAGRLRPLEKPYLLSENGKLDGRDGH